MRPEDLTGDEAPRLGWEEPVAHDQSRLLDDLGALLDALSTAPEVPGLDYDDIWRRIDRDIG